MWCWEGAADYGFWGRYDPPFGSLLLSFLVLLLSVLFAWPGQRVGTEVDTSAGQAKRG